MIDVLRFSSGAALAALLFAAHAPAVHAGCFGTCEIEAPEFTLEPALSCLEVGVHENDCTCEVQVEIDNGCDVEVAIGDVSFEGHRIGHCIPLDSEDPDATLKECKNLAPGAEVLITLFPSDNAVTGPQSGTIVLRHGEDDVVLGVGYDLVAYEPHDGWCSGARGSNSGLFLTVLTGLGFALWRRPQWGRGVKASTR